MLYQRGLLVIFCVLSLLQSSAFAIVFPDDALRFLEDRPKSRYPGSTALLALTVGHLYAPKGAAVGTGVHIGSGKILVAYHIYADYLANAAVKELTYRLRFDHCPTDKVEDCLVALDESTIEYRFCDPVWDFCVFEVSDPKQKTKMAKRHVFISTQKPAIDSEVITTGFSGGSVFDNPQASSGIIVDGERKTVAAAEKLRPAGILRSYGFTVSGEKGISNSPISLKKDPLLMIAYFWGVPEGTGLEKADAIRKYREGIAQKKDINELDSLLNWGLSAEHIAASLLKSPLKQQLCFVGDDRIYVCK